MIVIVRNIQCSAKFTIRPMNPSEANDVVDLIYDCYGDSYFYKQYYDPEVIIRLNENGYLRSVVAVTDKNEIIGHGALMKTNNDPQIVEPVMAFVKPAFRNQRVLTQIAEYLYIDRKPDLYKGVKGVYIPPVTKHTISQKEVYCHGFRDCGIWLGYLPDAEFKEIDTEYIQRITLVLTYLFVEQPKPMIIYPPKRHSDMIASLLKNIGVPNVECRIPEKHSEINVKSELNIKEDNSLNQVTIKIIQYGQDISSEISTKLDELCFQKYAVIHLYLDLHNPLTYYLAPEFEKMGFFFAGIMPGTSCNDALILQYLNNNPIDFNRILLLSDKAKEILTYILNNRRDLFYSAVSCGVEVHNESHQEEFDADRFAVDFIFRNLYEKHFLESSITNEYLSGPLIVVIAIALLTDDACEYNSVHPSVQERWNNILDAIQPYCPPKEFDILITLFSTINDYIQGHLRWWKSQWWI